MSQRYKGGERQLKSWYDQLEADKTIFMQRAEKASELTLPWFIPKDGNKDTTYKTLYQSVGAEGVTNLASRLIMVLMPPNRPLFRLRIPRKIIETAGQGREKLLTEINSALSRIEKEVTGIIEALGDRAALFSAMLHLLLSGNVLLHVLPDKIKVFSLRNYVVQRDPNGNVLTIIVREEIAYATLPKKIRKALAAKQELLTEDTEEASNEPRTYEIYTLIQRKADKWTVRQECEDIVITDSRGTYPIDLCPWLPLRLYRSEEEDYGRGYVEQYLGSLHSLECLSEALVQASAAAAKVIFLVHTNSTTKAIELAKADNLSFVQGNKTDVDVLQLEKYNDLNVAKEQIKELTQSLSKVFLMHTAIQRDAERVTAEEIRYMAQELETALGGLYSVLAKEFQKPYITLRIHYLQNSDVIEEFPESVKTEIVTGIDALGRGQDANALVQYGSTIFKVLPPEAVMSYVNVHGYLKALAAAYGIDDTTLLKTDEEVQQQQQNAQQQAILQKAMPNLVNAGGNLLTKSMENGGNPSGETQ